MFLVGFILPLIFLGVGWWLLYKGFKKLLYAPEHKTLESEAGAVQSWGLRTVIGKGLWAAAHSDPPWSKVEISDTWISIRPWLDKTPFPQVKALTYAPNGWPKETGWITLELVKGGFLQSSFLANEKTRDEIFACLRAKGVKCG